MLPDGEDFTSSIGWSVEQDTWSSATKYIGRKIINWLWWDDQIQNKIMYIYIHNKKKPHCKWKSKSGAKCFKQHEKKLTIKILKVLFEGTKKNKSPQDS